MQCRGLSARPLHPFGSPPEAIERPIGLQALLPRRSRRVNPHQRGISSAKLLPMMQAGWLSSGQTIGAARTAVRSACCLPELRVANRLRRLCPPGTRFPSFPLHSLRTVVGVHIMGQDLRLRAHQSAFLRPTHLRGPHCREYRQRFPQTTGPCPLPPSHCLFPFPERRPPYVHSL